MKQVLITDYQPALFRVESELYRFKRPARVYNCCSSNPSPPIGIYVPLYKGAFCVSV
jgi:hypothetical protein